MSPVSSTGESAFSPCTIGNICSVLGNRAVDSTCLAEPGAVTLISLQQCGNGIVEPGECVPSLLDPSHPSLPKLIGFL